MLRPLLFGFLLLGASSVFSYPTEIPEFIDFGGEYEAAFYDKAFHTKNTYSCPFNGAIEMATFFEYIQDVYQINTVVETGTFKANTTQFFGELFDTVHTIEVTKDFYDESQEKLARFDNVFCHFGSSPEVLSKILPSLKDERVVFYLDAHWYEDWPLWNELREISKTHKDNCIIVIDDFKVPGRADIPYDSSSSAECSYEYVKNQLKKVFTGYTIHYLLPKNPISRAKFVAIPKKWK